ncbi:hypothetical protein AX17_001098 [Amanita inopinata Kibby_2008]|nr:hypothetical protein AX17_001098 [Amanita inopinata Kibby_2008]
MATLQRPRCKHLVLDAGPLLSFTPLRGLAESFYTAPQVLSELKDKRAREHLEQLGLMSGVNVVIKSPDAESLAHVTQWAKRTGDYSVLSHPDLCILALTYSLHEKGKEGKDVIEAYAKAAVTVDSLSEQFSQATLAGTDDMIDEGGKGDSEPQSAELRPPQDGDQAASLHAVTKGQQPTTAPVFDDPSDEDDGEGEWITPDNVAFHKSTALDRLPSTPDARAENEEIWAACMTADFAMQNVLLQMGLNLVGSEGRRIEKIKTWVLRCHACFKICKDNSKKFCPSCGNPTLIRASVTVSKPGADPHVPALQVHLKKNFQYRLRGTKYSIPAPKPGSAKTGSGEGLILREDQMEYMKAKKRAEDKKGREEAKLLKGMANNAASGSMGVLSSWMDPDWVPELMTAGTGGKGRTLKNQRYDGDMPQIGYGRKNPNERRRHK